MAPQFKNRLVGITILVALVVIFLPSIIDGKKMSYQQEFVETPIKPELAVHTHTFTEDKVITVNPEKANVDNEQEPAEWKVEEVANTVEVDNGTVIDKKVTPTVKDTEKLVSNKENTNATNFKDPAWTIQLGAFQNKANINSLLKKLNKAGFQVHTIPKSVIDGQLTKVFVGPDVSKQKLENKLPRLKRLTSLNGKLVPFNPIEP